MEVFVLFLIFGAFVAGVVLAVGGLRAAAKAPPESFRAKVRTLLIG